MALEALGAPKVISDDDLLKKVHYATKQFGIKAYEKLAEVDTPYRKLILSEMSEKHSNCGGGCSNCSGKSSLDGTGQLDNEPTPAVIVKEVPVSTSTAATSSTTPEVSKTSPLLVTAVLLLGILTVAVIAKH